MALSASGKNSKHFVFSENATNFSENATNFSENASRKFDYRYIFFATCFDDTK